MAYLTATRYGLTHIDLSDFGELGERLLASGWRQVWEHPSGLFAMRHLSAGYWVVGDRRDGLLTITSGWCSSLRAAALKIERMTATSRMQPRSAATRKGPSHG